MHGVVQGDVHVRGLARLASSRRVMPAVDIEKHNVEYQTYHSLYHLLHFSSTSTILSLFVSGGR